MKTICFRRTVLPSLGLLAVLLPFSVSDAQVLSVVDIGLQSGIQDTVLGHHKTGRAGIAADFDLDGYTDFYIGNPGDESIVFRNIANARGKRVLQLHQVLVTDSLAWGGVAFDYDNDGDYDLFISCGANEGIGYDYLFRNDWILNGQPTGNLVFTDVTTIAGVAGPVPPADGFSAMFRTRDIPLPPSDCGTECGEYQPVLRFDQTVPPPSEATTPVRTASANAVVADYDQDGDNDLFVNGNIQTLSDPRYPELIGRNTLWRNNGNGTFTDVTYESGLGASLRPTRHSTFFDYDNDGDADLFENNFGDTNILWRNNGNGTFTDVTLAASATGEDLHYPWKSFASGAADLNNDGWEDLLVFQRGIEGTTGSPYMDGHALFVNSGGIFSNVASSTVINNRFVGEEGVMGCTVADVSGDGLPDIYVGNGGPPTGTADQFFVSVPGPTVPTYTDNTSMIDFPASVPAGFADPPYPYRTHGTTIFDLENDGYPELAVVNGGTARSVNAEPNRLFKFQTVSPYSWLKVRPIGNGTTVAKDAIGTRIKVDVTDNSGNQWSVYKTLFAGSCFSAQSGFAVHFGLGDATAITRITLRWPNGSVTVIAEEIAVNSSRVVTATGSGKGVRLSPQTVALTGEVPRDFALQQNYPNPFNPSTTINYSVAEETAVNLTIYDLLGREIATLVDEVQSEGQKSVVWNGTDQTGRHVASGVYVYRLKAGSFTATQKMMLSK